MKILGAKKKKKKRKERKRKEKERKRKGISSWTGQTVGYFRHCPLSEGTISSIFLFFFLRKERRKKKKKKKSFFQLQFQLEE